MPLADLSLGQCEDTGIQQHYEEMWDRIQGVKTLSDITSEYHEIGECFPFGAFNEQDYMWDQFAILNPDYVKVESTWINQVPLIKLIPDEALKRIVQTQSPRFIYEQLPQEIVKYVLMNQEIPLNPNNVFHIAHSKRAYELRGKSLIKRILKILMLEDRYNQASFALATRHAVPLTVVKLGDPTSVEESHFITYLQEDQLKVQTFKDMWDNFEGEILETNDKQTKDLKKYNLYTQSLDKNNKQEWNKIEYLLRHKTPNDMVEINTPYAKVRATTSHSFMWLNPDTLKYEKVSSKKLAERKRPTLVTFNRFDYSVKADKVFDLDLTEDLAYFLGVWTSDGSLNSSQGNILHVSNLDFGIINHLISLIDFGDKVPWYKVYESDTITNFSFRKLKDALLNYYGYKPKDKSVIKTGKEQIPQEVIFNENKSIVGAFFGGFFDGDGYVLTDSKTNNIIAGACSSKQFCHWLSLALLAQDIESRLKCKGGCWEVTIGGRRNILKFIDLVSPFVYHSKKKILLQRYLDKNSKSKDHKWNSDVYDVSEKIREKLLKDSPYRVNGGQIPLTYVKNYRKVLQKSFLEKCALDCEEKEILINTHTVLIQQMKMIKSTSEFVYNLMLEKDPHTYLVGGEGWLNTRNSGWIPNDDEINSVRDMFAAFETDPNFCYDEETECLTKNGWIKYTELTLDTEVACFEPSNNSLIYDKPSHINIQNYKGEMYHFNSRFMDKKVTPNHRMWAYRDGKWQILLAEDIRVNDRAIRPIEVFDWTNEKNKLSLSEIVYNQEDIVKEYYEGKIWCPTVKTGIIITKRNGKIAIEGQSLFYHYGIDVQFYGSNGKMLPLGPEFERVYRLKFIGMGVHEQLLAGGGGSYSQAYVNLEVQRQRYLSLQLKLENLVHSGWFKPVANLCGFYRIKNAISSAGHSSSYTYGEIKDPKERYAALFPSIRDAQDNKEFQEFLTKKAAEEEPGQQMKEYIFPKLDWGAMSAVTDENLKNWVKWLAQNRPYLVDDATVAKLANLDRDTQEEATFADLKRKKDRYGKILKAGLLPFVEKGKGGGGGMDLGGAGGVDLDMGGIPVGPGAGEPASTGGKPNAAIGENGPPDTSSGEEPPSNAVLTKLEKELIAESSFDDATVDQEVSELKKLKEQQSIAILKVIKKN